MGAVRPRSQDRALLEGLPSTIRVDINDLRRLPPDEYGRVIERLGLLREEFRRNPQGLFVPMLTQAKFLAHAKPGSRSFYIGGNRSGKTTIGVERGIIESVDRDSLPPHLQRFKTIDRPGVRGRIVVVDFNQPLQMILDKIKEWVPRDQALGKGRNWWQGSYDVKARRFWFRNESFIEFMSQDQDVDAHAGQWLDWVMFDEEPAHEKGEAIFDENLARLQDQDGMMWMTMTPLHGMSWVFERYILPHRQGFFSSPPEGEEDLFDEDVEVFLSDTTENKHVSSQGQRRMVASLLRSGRGGREKVEARRAGKFVAIEGLVFPSFDRERHVVPPLARLPELSSDPQGPFVVEGVDPGTRFPAVLLALIELSAEGLFNVTVFDEIRPPQGTIIEEVVRLRNERLQEHGLSQPRWGVIDPSAINRSDQTGISARDEYARHGMRLSPGDNSRTVGIGRVGALLARPGGLRVTSNCRELPKEFEVNRWPSSRSRENEAPERPVKRNDHSLDALRYIVMRLPVHMILGRRSDRDIQEERARDLWKDYGVPFDEGPGVEPSPGVLA